MADLTRCWCSLIHKGAVQAKTPGKHSMWRERVKSAILTLIAPIAGQVRPRAPANYTPHAPTNYTLQLNLHSARSRCVFFVLPCACEPIVGDQATARPGHSYGTPGPFGQARRSPLQLPDAGGNHNGVEPKPSMPPADLGGIAVTLDAGDGMIAAVMPGLASRCDGMTAMGI